MCATCLMRCALSIVHCALCIVPCALYKKSVHLHRLTTGVLLTQGLRTNPYHLIRIMPAKGGFIQYSKWFSTPWPFVI